MDTEQLAIRFRNFAEIECQGSSELYEFLAIQIAEDEEMLALAKEVPSGQPAPNLLFGAVHYLLLKGKNHPLKRYYPSVVLECKTIDKETFPHFKDFCHKYEREIIVILKNRLVQTNEVRRAAYLFPIFSWIHKKTGKALSIVEIGASAGLLLLWDQYRYSYGTEDVYGNPDSTVHINSEIRGGKAVHNFSKEVPPVMTKIGLDLHISDLRDEEDYFWLKSLIWPEHDERLALFEHAADYYRKNPVELIEGDGIAKLTSVVYTLPEESVVCVFHTHVANQIPEELKSDLIDKIKKIGETRDVFHIYNNMWDRKLHVDAIVNGVESSQTVGETDGHGRWFEWLLD